MPTLEHGGPWSVWDLKGLRPDRGRKRMPAQSSTAGPDGRAWLASGRRGPTAEEAARLLGILARFQAHAREASGASAEPRP